MAALEQPIPRRNLYLADQRKYKLQMENIIKMNTNLGHYRGLGITDCTLELAGYQVPIADGIRKMKNLTTLRLEIIDLQSSIFLEIESKKLKQLHLCWSKTPLPTASLFKNDLCYKDSLVELRMDENQWSEIPNGIFQFRNLLKLSLIGNSITELPDKFTNLPKLQELELSHNLLRHLPPSIFALHNLSKLYLTGNLVSELPDMFTNLPKLEALMLCDNRLTHIPASIFEMQKLSVLSLKYNFITELPDKFTNLSKLRNLSLSRNPLQYLPTSICSLHLFILEIEFNSFNLEMTPSVGSEVIVHSLKELSYRTILKHNLIFKEEILPMKCLKDLDNYRQCICGCKFVDEGQDLLFFCNLDDIAHLIDYNHDNHYAKFPIRGKMCNSLNSCFFNHFPKFK